MKKLLIYLDPSFNSNIGHYNRLAQNITTFVKNLNNIDFEHYINKSFTTQDSDTISHFTNSAFINYDTQTEKDIDFILKSFQNEASIIFERIKTNKQMYSSIIIYMYTASLDHIKILSQLNKQFSIQNLHIHTVLFYLNKEFTRDNLKEEYKKVLIDFNNDFIKKNQKNFNIYFDSFKAKKLYKKFFKFDTHINPIPMYLDYQKIKNNNLQKTITISYFGYQSYFHGFHIFYTLYKSLKNNPNLKFIVRANKLIHDDKLKNKITEIQNDNNVLFYENYINDELYNDVFNKSDIVVIPYLRICYPVQTSGIFIESVFENKYVIAADNTWMDYFIKKFNNGVSFDSTNLESIIMAFHELLDKIKKNKKNKKEIEKFKSFYTAKELFKRIGILTDE